MVKVVSPQKSMQVTCYQCKAGLEFVYTDIQEKTAYDYMGDRGVVKYIVCPCCSNEVAVTGSHSNISGFNAYD